MDTRKKAPQASDLDTAINSVQTGDRYNAESSHQQQGLGHHTGDKSPQPHTHTPGAATSPETYDGRQLLKNSVVVKAMSSARYSPRSSISITNRKAVKPDAPGLLQSLRAASTSGATANPTPPSTSFSKASDMSNTRSPVLSPRERATDGKSVCTHHKHRGSSLRTPHNTDVPMAQTKLSHT